MHKIVLHYNLHVGLGNFTYSICVRSSLIGCCGCLPVFFCAVFGAGGAAAESREQAEADEPGAGGAPEKPALSRPQNPRVGGVPAQRALPHIRGSGFKYFFIFKTESCEDTKN